ncbi:SDR family NAD(P)-dependent oxidoreductase [Nocardioides litoris]|uniref:SDR family NAD(P)-dependent oxidoreductase n=1 Tax=Nocardioides litoris TaxID=1926648 RepID=UPI0011219154|nr:SDR family oxidoreductase [Nocardioides litoris]
MLTRLLPALLPSSLPSLRRPGLVVVVTGASSGIGEATALRAASESHHLVLVARRREVLEEVAERCWQAGAASVTVEAADVGDDDAIAGVVERTVAQHGRLDAVLHCAGIVTYGRTEDVSADDFASVISTNLLGTATVARHVVPVLRRQEKGALVIVGSLLGHIAIPEMTPYVVSKWGVRALARQLQVENVDKPNVHISHVSPGSVDTPIYDNALDDAGGVNQPPPPTISPERVARIVLDCVGPRIPGTGGDVQTSLSNYGIMAAYTFAPWAYDRLVGPVFDAVSRRRGKED